MTLSAVTILVLSVIAAVVVGLGLWAYTTANRLDRLHVRSDLSWQALDAALARRAVVVRSIAASVPAADGKRLADGSRLLRFAGSCYRIPAWNARMINGSAGFPFTESRKSTRSRRLQNGI